MILPLLVVACVLLAMPLRSVQSFLGIPPEEGDYRHLYPTVCASVGILSGYGANALSYSLGFLETLRYPKDRMHVAFFVDETESSRDDLERWSSAVSSKVFRSAVVKAVEENWREEALIFSRQRSCDYALIMDSDCFILPDTLKRLIDLRLIVVSPLLNAPFGRHSNVDGLLDDDFVLRKEGDEFVRSKRVYYANSPLLIHLKHLDGSYLTFNDENVRNYDGSGNPTDVFGFSAYSMNIPIFVNNEFFYGYLVDSKIYSPLQHREVFNTFLANQICDFGPMPFPHSYVVEPRHDLVMQTKFGFDKIFLINLARRPERLRKMEEILHVLNVDYERSAAVDGQTLSEATLGELRFLPGYKDPFHQRAMKRGEIGCFLSHYAIWRRMVAEGLERVIVLEDDVRFSENGTQILRGMTEDLMKTRMHWDFIYLGRKRMSPQAKEFFVPGHRYLSTISYSYWTLGYAISLSGARKLLEVKPLEKLIALDEFLPIMYDQHPNAEWKEAFALSKNQTLNAYATYPVVVEPERYTNQPGYVSDTESSSIVDVVGHLSGNRSSSGESALVENDRIDAIHAFSANNNKDEL